jgi:hypothetical protein
VEKTACRKRGFDRERWKSLSSRQDSINADMNRLKIKFVLRTLDLLNLLIFFDKRCFST